jgi:hypothetical protein
VCALHLNVHVWYVFWGMEMEGERDYAVWEHPALCVCMYVFTCVRIC